MGEAGRHFPDAGMTIATIANFLENLNKFEDPDEPDDVVVGHAEAALRAGVRVTLAEYLAMTASLRAAFVIAGNRIMRELAPPAADPDDAASALSKWLDGIVAEGGAA